MIFEAVASGGKTVPQMLSEAAATVSFMPLVALKLSLLDVRDRDAFEKGHIPGARRKQ
jgi:rhodanese-related sulfurtransferase